MPENSNDSARFDKGAASWDANAVRTARANAVAREFGKIVAKLPRKPDLFEYGCGTGQSILPVAGKCRSVTGCDFSEPMLEKFRENAAAAGVTNAVTIRCDLRSDPLPPSRYDIVVCSMTLHHVEDVAGLLGKFALLLRPGGTVALVDLEKEDGSFHEDKTGVAHFGFTREEILGAMEEAGFAQLSFRREGCVVKPRGLTLAQYPTFLATGVLAG
jgi:2-polyprenyl-3-methyl-5-hydroxy-6-metoxy-1,4-benzoquinol methylase